MSGVMERESWRIVSEVGSHRFCPRLASCVIWEVFVITQEPQHTRGLARDNVFCIIGINKGFCVVVILEG